MIQDIQIGSIRQALFYPTQHKSCKHYIPGPLNSEYTYDYMSYINDKGFFKDRVITAMVQSPMTAIRVRQRKLPGGDEDE